MTSQIPSHLPRASVDEPVRCACGLIIGGIGAMRPAQAMGAFASVPQEPIVILRIRQLEVRTGLRKSSIYARLLPTHPLYDPDFPKPLSLAPPSGPKCRRKGAVGWIESEVTAYLHLLSSRRTQ